MAGSILPHIAEKLLDKLASFVVDEVSSAWGVKEEILKLQKTLVAISAVIADAEQREPHEHRLCAWLDDLRDVLDELENALDEFQCEVLRKQIIKRVIGRDIDRDAIVERLLCPGMAQNPFVVSIIGIGGLGKTTLAKLVYNDSRVEVHFEKRIWVCVSEDFNLKNILQKIVSHMSPTADQSNNHDLDVELLQANLRGLLKDKKFLLVLDDVWNENRRQWNELADLLYGGTKGSSLIVTTRNSNVVSTVRASYEHKLEGLSRDDCIALIEKHAKVIDPELLEIVSQIVGKCGGVPLVLSALGGMLHSNTDVRHWRSILAKDILSTLQNEDDIIPIIRLSYDHLPPHLKRCCAFCSLFPKDHSFWSVTMRSFWKSAGLIDTPSDTDSQDEECNHYMRELLARSFFQDLEDYGVDFHFRMHDIVHDLALLVAQNECSIANFDTPSIQQTVRHTSFFVNSSNRQVEPLPAVPPFLRKPNRLHTLIFQFYKAGISKELVNACISNCKYLRLLDLKGSNFEVMPRSIDTLKHLRFLSLYGNERIRRLPNSICDLQSLQILWLERCDSLEELPRDMWKLINLEQLSITTRQKSLKSNGIGCLKSLRYLWINRCNNLESLFEGMDTESFTALQGLYIFCCSSLTSIPVNRLNSLNSLEVLSISYCEKLSLSMDGEAVFSLTLREFRFSGFPLMLALPEWVHGSANTLQSLRIHDCQQLEDLPDWLPKLSHLKRLEISECYNISSLPDGMKSLAALQHLEIDACDELGGRCQPNRPDWHKIAHIPEIKINGKKINY
ncbi:hypothetical protein CRG98_017454 [Punica granatum]|uniref:Disease resistance protein RGA3 n=1 Tax=Punica granatum TaxID=22663 RepID=A0A2I0K0J1_PUNGR|nr:hypothetical protein CRG98_017454 [Punica granatum]